MGRGKAVPPVPEDQKMPGLNRVNEYISLSLIVYRLSLISLSLFLFLVVLFCFVSCVAYYCIYSFCSKFCCSVYLVSRGSITV